jgi:hypothetical protein
VHDFQRASKKLRSKPPRSAGRYPFKLVDNVWFASEGPALAFAGTDVVIENNAFLVLLEPTGFSDIRVRGKHSR